MSSSIHLNDLAAGRIPSTSAPRKEDYVVYGGTFDPIHEGHLSVIRRLMEVFTTLVIAPATINPWKGDHPTSLALRVEMIERVLKAEGLPVGEDVREKGIYVEDSGYVYAEDLVRSLRSRRGGELFWAIGEDGAKSIMQWRNWKSLEVTAVVVPITIDIHATQIRAGEALPHPALRDFIAENRLY